jgi:prepilin peptidase CpaA
MDGALNPSLVMVVAFTMVAAVFDLWRFKVPNLLTLPMLALGISYHCATGGIGGLLLSLMGALVGFATLFLLYIAGGLGAGDVKLMAGAGAWLGPLAAAHLFIIAGLATALCSVALLLRYGSLNRSIVTMKVFFVQLQTIGRHLGRVDCVETAVNSADRRKRLIPFAAMVAIAAVALLIWQSAF